MQRATAILTLVLLTGCSASGDPPPEESGPASDLAQQVVGEWRITDEELGSMALTIDEDLNCVLTDTRGKPFEFEAEEDGETLEAEVDVGERGMKILLNQPETSLEVAGSMNYSMGSTVIVISPITRDGKEVLWLQVYRESRPEDTRRSINLLPVAPPADAPPGE